MLVAFRKSVMTIATPAEDDDNDGVGDDGDAGEDGHDDAEERVDKVERPVEFAGVHQVAGGHVRVQATDPGTSGF